MALEAAAEREALIGEVETVLAGESAGGAPSGFVEALLGRTALEDLAPYPAESLARIADSAFRHLSDVRPGGRHDIRLLDHEIEADGGKREITVVEVVNDNMPFLLDSTLAEIVDQGYEPRLVAHPILAVERDEAGAFKRLVGEALAGAPLGARRESFIHVHLDRIDDEAARARLAEGLDKVYVDVERAVRDWAAMRARLAEAAEAYKINPPPLPADEVTEAVRFLEWIAADNFTILGAREYRFAGGDTAADPVEGTGLGILRDPSVRVLRRGRELVVMTPEIRAFLDRPVALIITKANVKSRVHRRAHLDYIGVKLFSPDGRLEGELRVVGLFTANAYTGSTSTIPYLRHKVAQVVRRAGFDPASYSGRALLYVLEGYPRDELFQVDIDTLYRFSLDILQLTERPRVRALARADEFDRFVSVLVYIPKDRYDTHVRQRVGEFLARAYQGRVSAAYPSYPEGTLARTHFIIGRDDGRTPVVDQQELEAGITAIVRTWSDALKSALESGVGGARARLLAARYGEAFSAAYREAFSGEAVIGDIAILETLSDERPRAVDLYRREGEAATRASLKVFARGAPMPLSERVPLLERLGFRVVSERTYRVVPHGAPEEARVWLHDMALERATGGEIDVARLDPAIEAALMALFRGLAESDGFNALVLEAGLGWRDVAMMRAFGRYLQQVRVPYAQDYLAATLARHPAIAVKIVELFYARFDPRVAQRERDARQRAVRAEIEEALKAVTSLDDDRILRRFVNLIEAAVRTNFFQVGPSGLARETIAFKFDCARVEGLPKPRPLYEIFVYSPRVEGVHLRFGKVARGGLRWSDRPQDFRTEVLGLVKAQQVKNAVIVPVGAKGGFVPKHLPSPSDRQAWLAEGTESYKIFVSTLLDLTDNLEGDRVVPPAATVRHDGDDPYLVVAADKGTATFSDIANSISAAHHHWLGDAFASGGSKGYDHKGMGITARGAWEAVKRHFREIDIDIQSTPVTVAGVGDMSGDVFGNGMLLSRALKLVAAFDHRDIFLDPDPDPATSWAERKRLFDLARSSWQDYDKSLISEGGGVFSRTAKSIPLSAPVRALLGLDKAEATPQEVMNAILKAPVDLLWFGGIGTYIRASDESDDQVGDRANDAIRITGGEVRAKVVGEGANLGATQKGRIEAAKHGVRLNTDAIDNSAGVNTSDVEVNIKIALSTPERDGRLSEDDRNALLAEMTDEVGRLVLRNNYLQTLALSLAERQGAGGIGFARRLMQALEAEGRLDRAVEFLPDDIELSARERRGEGLTRPELAVLLAYAKLALHDALIDSPVPDEPYLARELARYMPVPVRERFPDAVETHRLRREIIATQLANAIVNRGGPTVVTRLVDQTGTDAPTIAAAYAVARDSFGLVDINAAIDALDGRIRGQSQLRLYAELQDLLLHQLVWFIREVDFTRHSLDEVVTRYGEGITAVEAVLDTVLTADAREGLRLREEALVGEGVPGELARKLAHLPALAEAPDIVLAAQVTGRSVADVAATHFAVEDAFRLGALAAAGRDIPVTDHYDRLALDRAVDGLSEAHRKLTAEIVASGGQGAEAVGAWAARRGAEVARIRATVDGIAASGLTLSKLTVAASLLGDLARG
ncbi:NAD-glutamate dehydrogenase [Chelatococcus sp. SYSU_G07232]|uniref:NAD-glutamate dehydrogenase n=1 Tax=Chelatococcus albus TaxID=3047466 RepID=A0ABT7AK78_9HYPH|nr:NAD-glutamate dehydrogenase [Chelatococcus sp. SYSU_G07232]MDJ1159767.1 NAD-glutamate dehydrogenase [Chelatococcus sp. SYSU_G07232]